MDSRLRWRSWSPTSILFLVDRNYLLKLKLSIFYSCFFLKIYLFFLQVYWKEKQMKKIASEMLEYCQKMASRNAEHMRDVLLQEGNTNINNEISADSASVQT